MRAHHLFRLRLLPFAAGAIGCTALSNSALATDRAARLDRPQPFPRRVDRRAHAARASQRDPVCNALTGALARAEASLPPRDAAAFGAVMRRDAPNYAAAARQLRETRDELARQITAQQFDQAGAQQALTN
ncbi:MAG: hypothetical protein WA864_14645 [Acetobacteraceae bacterium]|jgi:hypothetical protein